MTSKKQNVLATLGLVVVALVVIVLLLRPSGAQGTALRARENATRLLGARIATLRPDCRVLVLSNPFVKDLGYLNEMAQFERAGLNGLRAGLGSKRNVKVVHPEIRPEHFQAPGSILIPPDSRNPLSFLILPASVQALALANPECDIIASLIGLPVEIEQLGIWDANDRRSFALLLPDLRLLGSPEKVVEAFRRGKLLVVVTEVSGSPEPLIVTQDNVAEVLERTPKALGF